MEAIEAATHAQAPAGNVYGLGAETPSRRRVTDDVFDMGVVRGRDRNSLSSLNLSFDIYPSPNRRINHPHHRGGTLNDHIPRVREQPGYKHARRSHNQ